VVYESKGARWKDSGRKDVQEYTTIPAYCQCRHRCAREYHWDQERDGTGKEKKSSQLQKFDQSEREERRMKEYESAWLCIVVIAIGRETKQGEREEK